MSYPKSVFFILTSVFFETLSFNLYQGFLIFYLFDGSSTDDTAHIMMNVFSLLINFFPIFGAIIADSWLGNYETIIYLNIIYAFGQLLLFMSTFSQYFMRDHIIVALFLTAMGTGGIRACIQAIGGDQFTPTQQKTHLTNFFWFYYFIRHAGTLFPMKVLTEIVNNLIIRKGNLAFPCMFSIPFSLTILSLAMFAARAKMYRTTGIKKNIVIKVYACIWHALYRKMFSNEVRNHWLDYADDRYDQKILEDTKLYHKVCMPIIPLPFFWAVFRYAYKLWDFQEIRMQANFLDSLTNPGSIKDLKWIIILIFIPITRFIIYPIIEKILSINTPLKKMTAGGILVGVSLAISAVLELYLKPTNSDQPIYWFLPQHIVCAIGEIMFSITGMEFVFTQAPVGMKSWLQGYWLLNIAVGQLIVSFIPYRTIFQIPAYDFFLFAGIIFVIIFIFAIIAKNHTYVEDSPT